MSPRTAHPAPVRTDSASAASLSSVVRQLCEHDEGLTRQERNVAYSALPSRDAMVRQVASTCGMRSWMMTVSNGHLPSRESQYMVLPRNPFTPTTIIGPIRPARIRSFTRLTMPGRSRFGVPPLAGNSYSTG